MPSSVLFLLGANAVPLYGVIFWGWSIVDILFLYWAESGIIGLFSIPKIILAKDKSNGATNLLVRIILSGFFVEHFGAFMLFHGYILYSITSEFLKLSVDPLTLLWAARYALAALLVSHGYSFITNFIGKREMELASSSQLMLYPYRRIIVMQITLIIGLWLVKFLGQPIFLLLVFVLLKTALDVNAHLRERQRFEPGNNYR